MGVAEAAIIDLIGQWTLKVELVNTTCWIDQAPRNLQLPQDLDNVPSGETRACFGVPLMDGQFEVEACEGSLRGGTSEGSRRRDFTRRGLKG